MQSMRTASISLFPFREEFRTYSFAEGKKDLLAALAVALMTIPQSIAYSLLAGLPPSAGLFSAILGTFFTATWGSSKHLIAGPSTGIAILIQTSIADILYNYFETVSGPQREELILHILLQITLIMGLFQIGAAFFNVRKVLQFISRSVMLGYFAGITVAIAVGQLFYFFGIESPGGDDPIVYKAAHLVAHLREINLPTLIVGLTGLAVLLFVQRRWPNWPGSLAALVAAAFLAHFLSLWPLGEPAETLRSLEVTGHPPLQFTFPWLDFKMMNKIFPSAIAIASLAIVEVFSVSRNFGARSGQEVQINQDVFGLGVGNLVLSCVLGAMPCSGSVSRTALNFRMQAKTRLSAIVSALLTGVFIYVGWPLVERIPLAALAALLIATLPTVTNRRELKLSLRATREDRWVFSLTFLSCLIFHLDIAFFIGIVISIASYLRKSSEPSLVEYAFNSKGRLLVMSPKEEVYRKVRIIGIGGELYFAAADFFQAAMMRVIEDPHVEAVVLRLNNVHHMDASMCLAILRVHEALQSKGHYFLISGLTEEVWRVFHRAGLVKQIGLDNLYFTDESNPQFSTWKACLRAQDLVHKRSGSG